MPTLPTVIYSFVLLLFFGLYLRERTKNQLNPPSPEWEQKESGKLIQQATRKADTIMTEAELAAMKIEADTDIGTRLIRNQLQTFEADYQRRFEANMTKLQEDFATYLAKTETEYHQFLEKMQANSSTMSQQVEAAAKAKINEVLFNFEQNLANFLASSEQKSLEAVELELRSARQLVDTYRQSQLKIIDENIVAVLEKTLSIVLQNKMSLKDQTDMVYEALEKAKAEKFFG